MVHVASGSFNDIYQVSADSETVIVKNRRYRDPRGWASTEMEAFALRHLRSSLPVPELRFHSQPTIRFPYGYLVCSREKGTAAVPSGTNAVALGKVVATLHKTRVMADLENDARHSRDNILSNCESLLDAIGSTRLGRSQRRRIEILLQFVMRHSNVFHGSSSDDVVTHGDPVPSNFLYDAHLNSLTTIDWETFCLAPRTFDLWACMSSAFVSWDWPGGMTSRHRELFISSYSAAVGLPTTELARSVWQSAPIYALRHGLWCLYRATELDRKAKTFENNSILQRFLLISQRAFDEAQSIGEAR